MEGLSILIILAYVLSVQKISNAVNTITATQILKDGDTIVSSDGNFEMGFFSPGNSNNRYVGIWYKKISVQTVVWVANREIPLTNTSEGGVLKVINPGILVLGINNTNNIIWSSKSSRSFAQNPVAQLLDSGNLVVREANDDNPENFLWQSFDYPTDTLLPGMKLGKNFVTGLETYLSSWKTSDDPAPGEYTYHCDPSGYPQLILRKGSVEQFRTGPWNGVRFSGSNLKPNSIYTYGIVFNNKEVYYSYELLNSSVISRYMLNHTGFAQRWTWVDRIQGWVLYLSAPRDNCDAYSLCGAYGSCNIGDSPICGCLDKFVPKQPEDWDRGDWSKGCVRKKPLDCHSGDEDVDVFLKYPGIRLPDTQYSWFNRSMNLEECKSVCLNNCSCTAYSNLDIREEGSGCLLWFDDLIDTRVFANGQDIYIRMASTELVIQSVTNRKKGIIIKVSFSLLVGMVLLGLGMMLYIRKKKRSRLKREGRLGHALEQDHTTESQKEDVELPVFGLSTIANATNNFSCHNKLGEGGFGPVYKGVLEEEREIAVKRLSKTSRQGLDEFKNEVICIAKLQHRNLVKLLGCCIQGEETMLIYEYMPNKSLDSFIFDKTQSKILDWPKRFHIINGIARGLLYLHQDSRLRIIHRDLKASNVLLDFDMHPKISDFGMARSFGGNETGANTTRVAWRLYNEGRSLELMDDIVAADDSSYLCEVIRSIQVGLLCVQQCPEDRPSMSSVVLMLGCEGALHRPKQPGFFTERTIFETECSSSSYAQSSNNEITITQLDGR